MNHPDPLLQRGSSRRYASVDYAMPGVPRAVLDSWDWCMRTDPDLVRGRRRHGDGFSHLVRRRLHALRPFRVAIDPRLRADLAYVRYAREAGWLREIGPLAEQHPSDSRGAIVADDRWLFCNQVPVLSGRCHKAHWAQGADLDPDWSMPRASREYETRQRHRLQHFVPSFCTEANWLDRERLSERYVALPDWWADYEMPYGTRMETPRVVAYFSRRLIADERDAMWCVLRTEWAAEALKEVLLAARAGRMYWLPERVRDDIATISVRRIFRACREDVIEDAEKLFGFIRRADWSRCPSRNRSLPEQATRFSPVYRDTGDYFDFCAERWTPTDVPMREVDADGAVVGPGGDRGPRLWGSTRGRVTRDCPTGYSRGFGAFYPSARQRRSGDAGRLIERENARRRMKGGSSSGSGVTPSDASGDAADGVNVAPWVPGGVVVSATPGDPTTESATRVPAAETGSASVVGPMEVDSPVEQSASAGDAPTGEDAVRADGGGVEEGEFLENKGRGGETTATLGQSADGLGGGAASAPLAGVDRGGPGAVRPDEGTGGKGRAKDVDAVDGDGDQKGEAGCASGPDESGGAALGGAGEASAGAGTALVERTASMTLDPGQRARGGKESGACARDGSPAGRAAVQPNAQVRKSPRLAAKRRG